MGGLGGSSRSPPRGAPGRAAAGEAEEKGAAVPCRLGALFPPVLPLAGAAVCGGAAAHLRERRGAVRGRGAAPRNGNPATSARVSLGNLGYSSSLPGGRRRRARTRGEARGYFWGGDGVSQRCAAQEVAGTQRWSGAVLAKPGVRPELGTPSRAVCGAGWHIACRAWRVLWGAQPAWGSSDRGSRCR